MKNKQKCKRTRQTIEFSNESHKDCIRTWLDCVHTLDNEAIVWRTTFCWSERTVAQDEVAARFVAIAVPTNWVRSANSVLRLAKVPNRAVQFDRWTETVRCPFVWPKAEIRLMLRETKTFSSEEIRSLWAIKRSRLNIDWRSQACWLIVELAIDLCLPSLDLLCLFGIRTCNIQSVCQ